MKLFSWKLANKLLHTPAAPVVAALFRRRATSSVWDKFVPSAVDAAQLSVWVEPDDFDAARAKAIHLLREHGVVLLPALVATADASAAGEALSEFLETFVKAQERDPGGGALLGCDWQTGTRRYPDFLTRPVPVVTFLGGDADPVDAGFIVLSRMDLIATRPGHHALLTLLQSWQFMFAEQVVTEMFSVARKIYQFLLSRSAERPRTIHTDTLGEHYNIFTYLSDVISVDDGPFTYVPGSHLRRDLLTKGAFFLKICGKRPKEYPELSSRAVPMLGAAGTVIISNQRGVHGAHPQREGRHRAMLIVNLLDR